MKFKRDVLQALAGDIDSEASTDGYEIVRDELAGTSRWSIIHSLVFKFDGKFYQTNYRTAATECQDERPFEYEGEEIECKEVFQREVTAVVYLAEPA